MDKEMSEILRSFNKGRQSTLRKQSKSQKSFSPNVNSKIKNAPLNSHPTYLPGNTTVPEVPIKLTKTNNVWEWNYCGIRMRINYSAGLWFSEDGMYVFWAWWDRTTDSLTQIKSADIYSEMDGRRYVVNPNVENSKPVYIDEALQKCFKCNQSKPVQPATVATSTFKLKKSSFLPIKKPNVTIVTIDGFDYGFYYDPIKEGKNPMWVSKKGGQAAFIRYSWELKKYEYHIPYQIHEDKAGRKSVDVKEKDGTWTKYDLATAVCTVFNGNPTFPDLVVKFKDGNISNCDADNLYWDMP